MSVVRFSARRVLLLALLPLLLLACKAEVKTESAVVSEAVTTDTVAAEPVKASIPEGARVLMEAYPDAGMTYKDNKIYFPDGTSIVYDDGREKSFVEMLDNSDVEDMFSLVYSRDSVRPGYLADAGRSRCEALFKKMYGASAQEVSRHLVSVEWFGGTVRFTRVNGAADRLREVAKELSSMPELHKYLPSAGTFYWRKVRGANRQSSHSYGIAIDINTTYSNYWLWKNPGASELKKIGYENRVPMKIVEVFEKHGFVWGGRWYHYDTMHFEYRPEILAGAKR